MESNTIRMSDKFTEHDEVVRKIIAAQQSFEILTNIDGEKNFISGVFPDIILLDKTTKQPVFIIEVKRNGQIQGCLQQWNTISNLPATLYIVVPESDLSGAKLVATSIGLKAKFGTYKYETNIVTSIQFES
jgi:hypothetical protein